MFLFFPPSQEQLSLSPPDGIVSRFLEKETILSQALFQRLDHHIQGMKDDNLRTVSKCLQRVPAPVSQPTSVQNDKWQNKMEQIESAGNLSNEGCTIVLNKDQAIVLNFF